MVVSAAFGELAEILECLDRSDVSVEDISDVDVSVQGSNEITADVTVNVSLFDSIEFADGVSITADGADVLEEDLQVDMTVSITETADIEQTTTSVNDTLSVAQSGRSPGTGTPAYKDPDALETVYQQYDSFPQMTEALDVDVTPETVRRHMIKYGIHDPSEDNDVSRNRDVGDDETTQSDSVVDETDEDTTDDSEDTDPNLSERRVAEILDSGASRTDTERLVADGNGIPKDLTVGRLASALATSRTVYEATERLDASYETTRSMLEEFGLLTYVKGRITAADQDITPEEVCRRMGVDEGAV